MANNVTEELHMWTPAWDAATAAIPATPELSADAVAADAMLLRAIGGVAALYSDMHDTPIFRRMRPAGLLKTLNAGLAGSPSSTAQAVVGARGTEIATDSQASAYFITPDTTPAYAAVEIAAANTALLGSEAANPDKPPEGSTQELLERVLAGLQRL